MGAQLTYFTIQDLLTVKKKRIFLQILHQRLYSIHVHVHVHACVFSIKGCTLQILHTASLAGEKSMSWAYKLCILSFKTKNC